MVQERRLQLFCLVAICLVFLTLHFIHRPASQVTSNLHQYVPSYTLVSSNASSMLPGRQLPPQDATLLINLTDFHFLRSEPCVPSLYIVVVHSAPENQDKRHLIRSTWGAKVPVYFFIGLTSSSENETDIEREATEYRDIVQGNFHDSYRNLTYKHAMMMKWVVYTCGLGVKYVLKTDDDTFVNTWKMEDYLTHSLSPYGARNLLMCTQVERDMRAERSYRSKWRVSFSEFPGRFYPPYCWGFVLLYSPDMILQLYELMQRERKYFWIDDVFVTGLMVASLNLTQAEFGSLSGSRKRTWVKVFDDVSVYDPNANLFALIVSANVSSTYEYIYNETLTLMSTPVQPLM